MKIVEVVKPRSTRAGFIPYFIGPNGIEFLFMVSSNPAFGGPDPAIAKGRIDQGEDTKLAGIREATEELGLKENNLKSSTVKLGWEGFISGLDSHYQMSVFIGEVNSKEDFNTPDHEVSETKWLTLQQFREIGRKSHLAIVEGCAKAIQINESQGLNLLHTMTSGLKYIKLDLKKVDVKYKAKPGSQKKQCFNNAFRALADHPNTSYVLGYMFFHGIPIEHAWIKQGETYYDVTLDPEKQEDYISVAEFSFDEVMQYVDKFSHAPSLYDMNRFEAAR